MNQLKQSKKSIFSFFNRFLSGLVIALALSLTAFEWTTVRYTDVLDWEDEIYFEGEEMLPPITYRTEKVEMPKLKKPSTDFVPVIDLPDTKIDEKVDENIDATDGKSEDLFKVDASIFTLGGEELTDEPEIYEAVQVFAHYEKCTGLYGKELETCSMNDIHQRILENFKVTPQLRQLKKKQGAEVGFIIDSEGNVGEIKVLQSTSEAMSIAAIKAVQRLTQLIPAQQQGRDVALRMKIPIVFNFKE